MKRNGVNLKRNGEVREQIGNKAVPEPPFRFRIALAPPSAKHSLIRAPDPILKRNEEVREQIGNKAVPEPPRFVSESPWWPKV